MKKKLALAGVLALSSLAVIGWFSELFYGKNKLTPEQLPLSATSQVYGMQSNRPEIADVWPVWSLQVVWRRQSVVHRDNVGPFLYQLQLKTRPTLADVERLIPAPALGEGIYKPVLLTNIVQVGAQEPIGQPEPK